MNDFSKHGNKELMSCQRHAMTLIELLIVLALLGGLATIALTSMGELSASERVETTRQRLNAIRTAVVGDGVNPGRFLADMGRLPKVQETEPGMILSELWKLPDNALKYDTVNFDFASNPWPDSFSPQILPEDVSLRCGWNGPYIMISGKKLYDGFGNDFRLLIKQSDDTLAWENITAADEKIYGVQSLGQDNKEDTTSPDWYNADTDCDFVSDYSDNFTLAPETTLTVVVKARDASTSEVIWRAPVKTTIHDSSAVYDKGDYVTDTTGTWLFRCLVKDTTGALPTGDPPETNEDWKYLGTIKLCRYSLTHLRVALFIPAVTADNKAITWETSWDTVASEINLGNNITPGIRKLYVYGYLKISESISTNTWASGLQTIELKPGANFITVYLTEKLN